MRLHMRPRNGGALLLVLLCGCARYGAHGGPQGGEVSQEPLAHDLVRLGPEQLDAAGIRLETAGPGTLDIEISLPGEIELDPARVAHVVPPVSGFVRAVARRLGDPVRAGETLLVLESSELANAKSDYLTRQKTLELARIDLERAQSIQVNTTTILAALDAATADELARQVQGLDLGGNLGGLLSAYAGYLAAQLAYQRQQALAAEGLTSEAELQGAHSAQQQALATYFAMRDDIRFASRRAVDEQARQVEVASIELAAVARRLQILGLDSTAIEALSAEPAERLSRLELRSPIDGRLISREAVLGEELGPGARPLVVADLRRVLVRMTVFPRDLESLRPGQSVSISDGRSECQGTVACVVPLFDGATRSASAMVPIENPQQRFLPGSFVTCRVLVEEAGVPLLVPRSAVQTLDGRPCVFVQTPDGFQAQPISIARQDAAHLEVIGGLSPGQRYIVAGSFVLKAELRKMTGEEAE